MIITTTPTRLQALQLGANLAYVCTNKEEVIRLKRRVRSPNRNCYTKASNGELWFENGGTKKNKRYIDGIIRGFPSGYVVAVVESDSLAPWSLYFHWSRSGVWDTRYQWGN